LHVHAAKDADEKEQWILALENAISRQDLNQVCSLNVSSWYQWICTVCIIL